MASVYWTDKAEESLLETGEWGKRMQCARGGIWQGSGGQGNLVLHDCPGGEARRTGMDSDITA
jgi:hypothetical protein